MGQRGRRYDEDLISTGLFTAKKALCIHAFYLFLFEICLQNILQAIEVSRTFIYMTHIHSIHTYTHTYRQNMCQSMRLVKKYSQDYVTFHL